MVLSPDGKALFVACANSTKVSVIDPSTGKGLQTIVCSLYPSAPNGNTPNSLALTPDGEMLFVANADANNLAVFNVADRANAKSLGFIPTGWYPTSVRFNKLDRRVYYTNGKGLVSKANRSGPNPNVPLANNLNEYIGSLFRGTLGILDAPTPEQMARFTKTAYQCSPLQRDDAVRAEDVSADNPIPRAVGGAPARGDGLHRREQPRLLVAQGAQFATAKRTAGQELARAMSNRLNAKQLIGLDEIIGEQVALVGHQPWMGEAVAWLTTGSTQRGSSFIFKRGGVAWLEGSPKPGFGRSSHTSAESPGCGYRRPGLSIFGPWRAPSPPRSKRLADESAPQSDSSPVPGKATDLASRPLAERCARSSS